MYFPCAYVKYNPIYCYGKQFKIVITPNPKLTNFNP